MLCVVDQCYWLNTSVQFSYLIRTNIHGSCYLMLPFAFKHSSAQIMHAFAFKTQKQVHLTCFANNMQMRFNRTCCFQRNETQRKLNAASEMSYTLVCHCGKRKSGFSTLQMQENTQLDKQPILTDQMYIASEDHKWENYRTEE